MGQGDKGISEIFESCDPNSLDWRERLLLISENLGHAPKAWVGDMQILSLTWTQVLHNHTIKCNLRCPACCHSFRFLSPCQKLLRCSDVLHTGLFVVCGCFCFIISFISSFPQQISSGKLSGCRSFLWFNSKDFTIFTAAILVTGKCSGCTVWLQSQSISCSSTRNTSQRISVQVCIYL